MQIMRNLKKIAVPPPPSLGLKKCGIGLPNTLIQKGVKKPDPIIQFLADLVKN